jgi:hypothetical protein
MTEFKCAVPGCAEAAVVEVRLYDLYLHPVVVFDEQDYTCPYLCAVHLEQNEEEAKGERTRRAWMQYPYTNRHKAQGFTIYRDLRGPRDDELQ